MTRMLSSIFQLLSLTFAILALSFSLVATTSKDWSYRNTYAVDDLFLENPIYTEYRSPFIICVPTAHQTNGTNGTVFTTYSTDCHHFQASEKHGRNSTSCELISVTKDHSIAITGDARLCQQIHYAGNLIIASTTFIGVGFVFSFLSTMTAYCVNRKHHKRARFQNADQLIQAETHGEPLQYKHEIPHPEHHEHHHHMTRGIIRMFHFYHVLIVLFFVIGSILTLLSQFYGVLAFTMSAPDNGKWSINEQAVLDQSGNSHEPWVQGEALTVYASLTWLCAGLGAALSSMAQAR